MRKNKQFNDIFEECLEQVLTQGKTIEQCLASYPDMATQLEPLLRTALAVKKAASIEPAPEMAARVRYRLTSRLQAKGERKKSSIWQPRWATVIAGVLLFFLVGSGTVVASSSSMPDSPLYPVKLAAEQVQIKLTRSKIRRAILYAELANKRVAEIAYMADAEKLEKVEQLTQKLDVILANVAMLAGRQKGEMATLSAAPFATESPTSTPKPMASVPGIAASPGITETPTAAPGPSTDKQTPTRAAGAEKRATESDPERAKLKLLIVRYAANHPAVLRAVLEKAPPSARAAIIEAIRVSQRGYEQALKAMEDED